jgi:hypothetical protein
MLVLIVLQIFKAMAALASVLDKYVLMIINVPKTPVLKVPVPLVASLLPIVMVHNVHPQQIVLQVLALVRSVRHVMTMADLATSNTVMEQYANKITIVFQIPV